MNQIEKAYGQNNAILDNCHVRVAFATNDERTAKRISDALGATTEIRAMRNYAGHRLSPWLGHLMVSRQETARPLLTPGEIMQLPPGQEIVMVAGAPPIRARKVRYFDDRQLKARVVAPPNLTAEASQAGVPDDWSGAKPIPAPPAALVVIEPAKATKEEAEFEGPEDGRAREPGRPELDDEHPQPELQTDPQDEFTFRDDRPSRKGDPEADRLRALHQRFVATSKLAALDRGDGMSMDGGR